MAKHFEEIWEDAEKASTKQPTGREELYIKIEQEMREYAKLDIIPSKEIQNILKTKKLGEILFKISELSRLDNINTFAALQLEVQIAEKANQ
jgi:hypothetical protein